jgi:hypothetical protein
VPCKVRRNGLDSDASVAIPTKPVKAQTAARRGAPVPVRRPVGRRSGFCPVLTVLWPPSWPGKRAMRRNRDLCLSQPHHASCWPLPKYYKGGRCRPLVVRVSPGFLTRSPFPPVVCFKSKHGWPAGTTIGPQADSRKCLFANPRSLHCEKPRLGQAYDLMRRRAFPPSSS